MIAQWMRPEIPLQLPRENEVDVWRVQVSREEENAHKWRGLLTSDELAHADRFHFDTDRRSYTVTRGILRTLLGQYLRVSPNTLAFAVSRFGKPDLPPSQNPTHIAFNVSHSADFSLLAFAVDTKVGVDVEHVRKKESVAELARVVLSPAEYAGFAALADADRQRAFFRAWTRKEALVKAIGEGLSIPLDSIDLAGPHEWALHDLNVHENYAAAVAVKAPKIDLRLWNY